MSGLWRFFRSTLGFSQAVVDSTPTSLHKLPFKDPSRFAEGERVLVNRKSISQPLRKNVKDRGIDHNDIIGQPISTLFLQSQTGDVTRVERPSLEEYVSLAPRHVTPIYASYASFIVSLLDLHVAGLALNNQLDTSPQPRLEILEAGTGHGSLTLHLSRAIAAANPPPPALEFPELRKVSNGLPDVSENDPSQTELLNVWAKWRESRRAILHTVEHLPTFSLHAEKLIRAFRQGIYWPHVDFHVGTVEDWVSDQLNSKRQAKRHNNGDTDDAQNQGFLSHVLLDMPGVHKGLSAASEALRDGGKLLVFVPSVTQIGDCVREVHSRNLPLLFDTTIELGHGISNGRKWDVRLVKPRKATMAPSLVAELTEEQSREYEDDTEQISEDDQAILPGEPPIDAIEHESVMVCRPMVGLRTLGGGFVALWTKTSEPDSLESIWRRSSAGKIAKRKHRDGR